MGVWAALDGKSCGFEILCSRHGETGDCNTAGYCLGYVVRAGLQIGHFEKNPQNLREKTQ